jgi:MMP 1-O-methyltransferase
VTRRLRALADSLADLPRWLGPWVGHRRRLLAARGRPADLARVAATEGQMTDDEAACLYALAREAAGGCIVEIGSFHGKSTVALALGARAGGGARVYAVDPFVPFVGLLGGRFGPDDKTALLRNLLLAGVADGVWLLHLGSTQAARAWSEPIALLWVDGDHSEAAVRADLAAWTPYVAAGGLVALHDSLDPKLGPRAAIDELLASKAWERVREAGTITILRRAGSAGARKSAV